MLPKPVAENRTPLPDEPRCQLLCHAVSIFPIVGPLLESAAETTRTLLFTIRTFLRGFQKRPYDWEIETGVTQQLTPGARGSGVRSSATGLGTIT